MRWVVAFLFVGSFAGCISEEDNPTEPLFTLEGTLRPGRTQAQLEELTSTVRAHSPNSSIMVHNEDLLIGDLAHCEVVRAELDAKAYVVSLGACVPEAS